MVNCAPVSEVSCSSARKRCDQTIIGAEGYLCDEHIRGQTKSQPTIITLQVHLGLSYLVGLSTKLTSSIGEDRRMGSHSEYGAEQLSRRQ